MPLDCGFAAEGTGIFGMLCYFHFFHLLPERSTISDRTSVNFEMFWISAMTGRERVGGRLVECTPGTVFPGHANLCSHN